MSNALYQLAQKAHRAGQADRAMELYRELLAVEPTRVHAQYLLGCLLMDMGNFDAASECFAKAIALRPEEATYCEAVGVLHVRSGRDDLAEEHLRKAVGMKGARAEAFIHLGNLLLRRHDAAKALEQFREALKRFGPSLHIINGIVEACAESGRKQEAGQMIALAKRKGIYSEEQALRMGSRASRMAGDESMALEHAKKAKAAFEANPDCLELANACSDALSAAEQIDEAIIYSLKALCIRADNHEALARTAYLLSRKERYRESVRMYQLALKANPAQTKLYGGYSYVLYKSATKGRPENLVIAEKYARMLLAQEPDSLKSNTGMASIMFAMNRVREGADFFERAVRAEPTSQGTSSSRLFHDNYAWFISREEQYERHLEWARMMRKKLGKPRTNFLNDPDPERRIRVGFSSADFSMHPVSYFFAPVFSELKKVFDVYIYSNKPEHQQDDMTRGFRDEAFKFVDVSTMSDEQMAAQVVADGVDVLIDLSGHTSGNRLAVFAMRAAPVQASWLGYPNSTGLDTMDYRISDSVAEPEGDADSISSERIVRLPGGFHLYRPNYRLPVDIGPAPFLRNGFITFVSFNNMKKVSPLTISAWSALMRELPGSRIVVKDRALDSRVNRERLMSLFSSYGIGPSRIVINGMIKNNFDHLRLYTCADIALDSFPYNGTTTTCEALIMGCPLITMLGDRHASRVSASLLTHVGHPEWIAADEADFVRIGLELARDREGLCRIREKLREELLASPLGDIPRMEREMSDAIRSMWRNWCAERSGFTLPQATLSQA